MKLIQWISVAASFVLPGASPSLGLPMTAWYAFVASATDVNSGTFDFFIDGVSIEENLAYSIDELTTRTISWINQNTNPAPRYDNTRLDVTAVPEPSSLALLGLGVVGVFVRRKR